MTTLLRPDPDADRKLRRLQRLTRDAIADAYREDEAKRAIAEDIAAKVNAAGHRKEDAE